MAISMEARSIAEKLVAGSVDDVSRLIREALEREVDAEILMNEALLAGMDLVGQRFKDGEMFIPEVLRSAKAMSAGMELLRPRLTESGVSGAGTLVIGTVQGDLHEIGQNLVGMMFESGGFDVVRLGVDTKPADFVAAVKEHRPDIVGMSSLLTTTMPRMAETIKALQEANLRDGVKVIVGGAPVTCDFADEIGADGYGANAISAVELGKSLLGR
jgi:5-methyltetrahydrofolate--homocysteine methyltransferase